MVGLRQNRVVGWDSNGAFEVPFRVVHSDGEPRNSAASIKSEGIMSGITSCPWIDDIAYGVRGASAESNVKVLQIILNNTEEWRRRHGARFEPGLRRARIS